MGGSIAKLLDRGLMMLLVDPCDGEPDPARSAGESARFNPPRPPEVWV